MWSPIIRQMLYDGSTVDEIIAYFNHPIINETYISEVDAVYKKLSGKRYTGYFIKPRKSIPSEGTTYRKIYDYIIRHFGSIASFLDGYNGNQRALAAKIGVSYNNINNFLTDYRKGRFKSAKWLGHSPNLESKINLETYFKTGKWVKKKKRIALKDARNLW